MDFLTTPEAASDECSREQSDSQVLRETFSDQKPQPGKRSRPNPQESAEQCHRRSYSVWRGRPESQYFRRVGRTVPPSPQIASCSTATLRRELDRSCAASVQLPTSSETVRTSQSCAGFELPDREFQLPNQSIRLVLEKFFQQTPIVPKSSLAPTVETCPY